MSTRVLSAIDAGVRAGSVDVARRALRRGDWVLRRRNRRLFEARLLDAMVASEGAPPDPTLVHPLRVAALGLRGAACDPADPAATARAYEAAGPPPAPSKVPVATLATAALVALLAVAVVWLLRPGPGEVLPPRAYTRPAPPPTATAFTDGGVPLRDPELDTFFRDELARLVLAIDRGQEVPATSAAPPWMTARFAPLATAWNALVTAYEAWRRAEPGTPEGAMARDALQAAVRAVDEQFVAAGLGYWLDLDTPTIGGRPSAIVYSYHIDRVTPMAVDGHRHRALEVRRLDRLNLSHGELGLQGPSLVEPLVLLDSVERVVGDELLAVLGPSPRFELGDKQWRAHGDTADAVNRAASDAIRDELIAALGDDGARAREVGELLAERQATLGLVLPDRPKSLYLADGVIDALPEHPQVSRRRLRAIERALTRARAAQIVARLEDVVIAGTRIHEVQHEVDASEVRPYPAEIERAAGPEEVDERENHFGRRVTDETSAYLSELASGPAPRYVLWSLTRFAFDHVATSGVYATTAFVIIEALAQETGLPVGRLSDRRDLGALVTKLSALPRDQLQAAARRAWERLYATRLPTIAVATAPAAASAPGGAATGH